MNRQPKLEEEDWLSIDNICLMATDAFAGFVHKLKPYSDGPRYRVENAENEEVAIVRSLDEAIPAILAYYEKHPRQWECESAKWYLRVTHAGILDVVQDETDQWFARRDQCPLLRDGKPAAFPTREEAQRAADKHLLEGYPNSQSVDDGFSWLPDLDPEPCWQLVPMSADCVPHLIARGLSHHPPGSCLQQLPDRGS